jgi:ABC-2 type transport system permease protein
MNRGLLLKCLLESALLFAACGICLFAFAYFRVWVVSELDSARFKQIIDLLPKDWERFSSVDFQWLVSYIGRTASTLGEPAMLLLICLWSAVRSSDVVSGELNRGTLEMVLAQPVSRWEVYRIHALVTLCGLVLLCLLVWAGMATAVQFSAIKETTYPAFKVPIAGWSVPLTAAKPIETEVLMRDVVNPVSFLAGLANLFSVGVFMIGATSLLSAFDRYRWRTLGIAGGLFIVSGILKVGSLATPKLRWLGWFSYLNLYEPERQVKLFDENRSSFWWLLDERTVAGVSTLILGPLGSNLLLIGLGLLAWLVGGRYFQTRDLPPPV